MSEQNNAEAGDGGLNNVKELYKEKSKSLVFPFFFLWDFSLYFLIRCKFL